jgi:hypothetical protein
MYHVHNERGEELASGLYGPLLVLPAGARFDPEHERIVVIASGGPGVDPPRAVNGKTSPDTVTFVAGRTYRLRLIDITANEATLVELRGPGVAPTWRQLAADGRDLPEAQRVSQPARHVTASGVTRDFELSFTEPGAYTLALTPVLGGTPLAMPSLDRSGSGVRPVTSCQNPETRPATHRRRAPHFSQDDPCVLLTMSVSSLSPSLS